MRPISSNALAKLAQKDGSQPLNLIEIQWVDGGQRYVYTDLDSIASMAAIDNVTQVSGSGQSQAVSVTLADPDGTIKAIVDAHDIHLRPCWVYQWFGGLDQTDKFLIFRGLINTPITWKEGDRSLTFDVISKIEDAEVGFSIEEGDFISPSQDLIGKPWPLCFGTVINSPALRLTTPWQGTLATGVGISDWTLQDKLDKAKKLLCAFEFKGYDFEYTLSGTHDFAGPSGGATIIPIWDEQSGCAESRCQQVKALQGTITAQKLYEYSTIRVFNGENFPQGVPLKLNINGGVFTGFFVGEIFTITDRVHPDLANPTTKRGLDIVIDVKDCQQPPSIYQTVNASQNNQGPSSDQVQASQDAFNAVPTSQFFWADPGSTVTLDGDQAITYIANIIPSTILRVAAFRDTDAGQVLVTVPPAAYTVRQVDYVGYQVMEIVFGRPLSSLGVGWSDDIYVTQTSAVGPNTVDVIKWLIQTYTPHSVDNTSFDHVHALIDNYPSHFMMPGRMNIIAALDTIAYQARCAVYLKDDVFYIKYLPEEPTADDTVGVSDMLADSFELTHTPTEDLVTKYTATWQADYSVPDKNTVIYRSNVKKYGTHEQSYDYFIYNIIDLVRKSATFWLIRQANTWRKASFKAPLTKLGLEVFDTVSITHPALSGQPVKAVVEQASYDSASNSIAFECWTPLRSGETAPYDFAWPADVSETLIFPTLTERAAGFAGGGNGPNFTVKAPPGSSLSETNTFVQGFALECNGRAVKRVNENNIECHSDFGLSKPSDRGDTKPSPKAPADNSDVQGGYNPLPQNGNSGSNCCDEAMKVAQEALTEARAAQAAAGSGAGGGGDNPENAEKSNLPSKKDKQKDGKCLYVTKVSYIVVNEVHRPGGYTDDEGRTGVPRSDRPGDTGFVNGSTPAGSESTGFNTLAGAQAFAKDVQADIDARNKNGTWVVGQRQALLVFPAAGPEPVPAGSPPCTPDTGSTTKMVSFDKS